MTQDFSALYAQFKDILDAGTEDQADKFLIDHMNEFPEDMRQEVTMALFERGLVETGENQRAIDEIREDGMRAIDDIQETIRAIDDRRKIVELEQKIK
ncbi:MAG: hypothetical protein Q8R30_04375 [bacterium]|nr:hypothetical protein [bacterium]MDZ4285609.1 hypothetical protein [Candidatus Sungbacteria bacterium]